MTKKWSEKKKKTCGKKTTLTQMANLNLKRGGKKKPAQTVREFQSHEERQRVSMTRSEEGFRSEMEFALQWTLWRRMAIEMTVEKQRFFGKELRQSCEPHCLNPTL